MTASGDVVVDRARALDGWYHSMELRPGYVTPGWFDTRPLLDRLPLPADLGGLRCLDIGTFDGFWAFEMERRGAAEVVAVDVLDPWQWDWPADAQPHHVAAIGARKGRGEGFEIAREALGSKVERIEVSVYDLDPAQLGRFDFVYLGSLLLHLQNPVGALRRMVALTSGTGLVVDAVDHLLTRLAPRRAIMTFEGSVRPWWFKPNLCGLARMATSAGLVLTGPARLIRIDRGEGQPCPPARQALGMVRTRHGREAVVSAYLGDPHGVLQVRPRDGVRG